jgi:hypothetical protein
MNSYNRIPEKRPILFEIFCPKCGGSVYARDEEEIYVGRSEHTLSSAGYTITKLECVLCREVFDIDGIGLKYEQSIAAELGWPFPVKIPSGPNAIPQHVEERMRKRDQEPDPQGDAIDNFYADYYDRSPSSFEKEILRYVLKRKGHLTHEMQPVREISVPELEDTYNAQIIGVSAKSGFSRKRLLQCVHASNHIEGEIIESTKKADDGSTHRVYYVVSGDLFQPIAVAGKKAVRPEEAS